MTSPVDTLPDDIYSITDVTVALGLQPIVPDIKIEDVFYKFPSSLNFAYLPWHIHNISKWSRIVACCIRPILSIDDVKAAFIEIHGGDFGSKLADLLSTYLTSLDDKIVLTNGYTELQTFFYCILPIIQRSILSLPNSIKNDCNWYDHSVLPILSTVDMVPNDIVQLCENGKGGKNNSVDKRKQSSSSTPLPIEKHNHQSAQPNGFSLDEFMNELKLELTKTNNTSCSSSASSSTSTTTTTSQQQDELKMEQQQQQQQQQQDQNENETTLTAPTPTTTPTTGFFFGPSISKLILSRKSVLGLMAMGFFGVFDGHNENPQKVITATYPAPYSSISRTYYPMWESLQGGCVSEMYKYLEKGRKGAVRAKLQAMLSYFAFFFHNITSPQTSQLLNQQIDSFEQLSQQDHQQIVNFVFQENCVGCVEYCWKLPAIQVDFALDTIFNRIPDVFNEELTNNGNNNNNNINDDQNTELIERNLFNSSKTSKNSKNVMKNTPLSLLPVGSRRHLYIPQPRLINVDEFCQVFDLLVRNRNASDLTQQNPETNLQLAYNYIYAPERYPIEFPQCLQQQQRQIEGEKNDEKNGDTNPDKKNQKTALLNFSFKNPQMYKTNPFRRWLYEDNAIEVLWLMSTMSQVKLGMTFIGTTARGIENGLTYTNSVAMYTKLLEQVKMVIDCGCQDVGEKDDGQEEGENSEEYHKVYQLLLNNASSSSKSTSTSTSAPSSTSSGDDSKQQQQQQQQSSTFSINQHPEQQQQQAPNQNNNNNNKNNSSLILEDPEEEEDQDYGFLCFRIRSKSQQETRSNSNNNNNNNKVGRQEQQKVKKFFPSITPIPQYDSSTLIQLKEALEFILTNLHTQNVENDEKNEKSNSTPSAALFFTPNVKIDEFEHLQNDPTYASTHKLGWVNPNVNLNDENDKNHEKNHEKDQKNNTKSEKRNENFVDFYKTTQTSNVAPGRFRIQTLSESSIEHSIQADFANKYLGGGTLHSGCVQEEMVFAENFECVCGMMFSNVMFPNATIAISGVVYHATLGGYASQSFLSEYYSIDNNLWRWNGIDGAKRGETQSQQQNDKKNTKNNNTIIPSPLNGFTSKFHTSAIIAYDSTPYGSTSQQFTINEVKRQMSKLFSALTPTLTYPLSISIQNNVISSPQLLKSIDLSQTQHHQHQSQQEQKCSTIRPLLSSALSNCHLLAPKTFVTGNWGCGVFNATGAWILTLELLASSLMDMHLRYLNVGDERLTGGHSITSSFFTSIASLGIESSKNDQKNITTGVPTAVNTAPALLNNMLSYFNGHEAFEKMEFIHKAMELLQKDQHGNDQHSNLNSNNKSPLTHQILGHQYDRILALCLSNLEGPQSVVKNTQQLFTKASQWHEIFRTVYAANFPQ